MAVMRLRGATTIVVGGGGGGGGGAALAPAADQAGASPESGVIPDWQFVAASVVIVLAVWLLAFVAGFIKPAPATKLAEGVGVFALLYIAAQALERLLEPIAALDQKKKQLDETRDTAVATAKNAKTTAALIAAATAQAAYDKWRNNRAILLWGLATILGMAASAVTGIYLLDIVIDSPTPPQNLDILATGLVIGGGTKPLHDLITRIESSKNKDQDPPEATGDD